MKAYSFLFFQLILSSATNALEPGMNVQKSENSQLF